MRSFDASATAADVVPVTILARLDDLVGDYLLVGARARDLIVHCIAGLPLGRATHDVDISIAVSDRAEWKGLLAALGAGKREGVRIHVDGVPVDVLPYGGMTLQNVGPVPFVGGDDLAEARGLGHASRLHHQGRTGSCALAGYQPLRPLRGSMLV